MALGFVTAEGFRTSHVSIIARWIGIPAVVAVGHALQALLEAGTVAVDGGEGYVVANPNPATMAVLELTMYTCEAVQRAGIWVEVCGEAAGDPALLPKLVELGLGELSMSALSIPRAKKVISEL